MTGHKNQGERPINATAVAIGLLSFAAALLLASAAAVGAETARQKPCPAEFESSEMSTGETLRPIDGEAVVEILRGGEIQLALYGNGLICAEPVDQPIERDQGEVEAEVEVELEEQGQVALAFSAAPEPSAEAEAPEPPAEQSQIEPEPIVEPEPVEETRSVPESTTPPAVQARASVVAEPRVDQYATEMLRLINVERSEVGLGSLTRNADLDQYAQQWAVEMSNQPLPLDRARHHSPTFSGSSVGFREFPSSIAWTHAFENVGRLGSASGDIPADAISRLFYAGGGAGFTTSPTHYCNIVETAASEVGVGAYVDSSGSLWVAQVFWGTDSPAPDPLAACATTVAR